MSRRDCAWIAEPIPERRLGIKGPGAAQALEELGLAVPRAPNSWAPLTAADRDGSWNVVARLGYTEYFVEEAADAPAIAALEALLARGYPGACPVLREDCGILLGGAAANAVLAEVCNVDFAALRADKPIVMTSMIGVGVLVLPQMSDDEGPIHRIWCDPSFGSYLQTELDAIVTRITTGRAQ
jgi:sarcosine oxidase subunit gamma